MCVPVNKLAWFKVQPYGGVSQCVSCSMSRITFEHMMGNNSLKYQSYSKQQFTWQHGAQ